MRRSAHLPALVLLALAAGCPPKYPKCDGDKDCHAGEFCVNGRCQQCRSDGDCKGGKCNAGRCERGGALPPPPASCTLEPIYFDFNEYALTTEATASIDRDADCIKKSNRGATLTGKTDPRGTEEYNLALSDKRAQSVKERLARLGVTGNLKTVARGEMDATGKDEAGWAKDRRVDVAW